MARRADLTAGDLPELAQPFFHFQGKHLEISGSHAGNEFRAFHGRVHNNPRAGVPAPHVWIAWRWNQPKCSLLRVQANTIQISVARVGKGVNGRLTSGRRVIIPYSLLGTLGKKTGEANLALHPFCSCRTAGARRVIGRPQGSSVCLQPQATLSIPLPPAWWRR